MGAQKRAFKFFRALDERFLSLGEFIGIHSVVSVELTVNERHLVLYLALLDVPACVEYLYVTEPRVGLFDCEEKAKLRKLDNFLVTAECHH